MRIIIQSIVLITVFCSIGIITSCSSAPGYGSYTSQTSHYPYYNNPATWHFSGGGHGGGGRR